MGPLRDRTPAVPGRGVTDHTPMRGGIGPPASLVALFERLLVCLTHAGQRDFVNDVDLLKYGLLRHLPIEVFPDVFRSEVAIIRQVFLNLDDSELAAWSVRVQCADGRQAVDAVHAEQHLVDVLGVGHQARRVDYVLHAVNDVEPAYQVDLHHITGRDEAPVVEGVLLSLR